MDEKARLPEEPEEKAKELTPEELKTVAGGIGQAGGASPIQHQEGWIEINSFKWGGE